MTVDVLWLRFPSKKVNFELFFIIVSLICYLLVSLSCFYYLCYCCCNCYECYYRWYCCFLLVFSCLNYYYLFFFTDFFMSTSRLSFITYHYHFRKTTITYWLFVSEFVSFIYCCVCGVFVYMCACHLHTYKTPAHKQTNIKHLQLNTHTRTCKHKP